MIQILPRENKNQMIINDASSKCNKRAHEVIEQHCSGMYLYCYTEGKGTMIPSLRRIGFAKMEAYL